MARVFNKLNGELLTPADAKIAEEAFTPPLNYEFKHWSASADADDKVAELQEGGAGLVVNDNMTFYPVAQSIPMIEMTLAAATITYKINAVDISTHRMPNMYYEGHATFPSDPLATFNARRRVNVVVCPKKTATGELTLITTSSGGLLIEGGTSGSMPYEADTAAVDFGIIEFPNITAEGKTTKAWKITSDVDGEEYILSGSFNYMSVFGSVQPSFQVYKVIDGKIVNVKDLNIMYRFVTEN